MSVTNQRARARRTPAVLSLGFRPFFLAAGTWAIVAIFIWVVMLDSGGSLPSLFDPLNWHIHEMLFGFVMAPIAGFLLTAIPNWTNRPPVRGIGLALLLCAWLTGRVFCLVSALVPFSLAVAAELLFPVALIAVAAREIVVSRNWRNLPLVVPLSALGAADLLMLLEAGGVSVPAGLGWRLALAAIIVLISVVAGRIVPNFTRNWLAKRGVTELPAGPGQVDRIALGALQVGMFGWAFFPSAWEVGVALLIGAALNLFRVLRWRGGATFAEPLLFVLHVGYGWLVIGTALLGLTTVGLDIPFSAAIHTLTAGTVGTMILAVMTRVTLGHTGRALCADRATGLIYCLVGFAAVIRVAAAFAGDWALPLLIASACVWIAAFGLFGLRYGPLLLKPRPTA